MASENRLIRAVMDIVPDDLYRPWNFQDILYYFYSETILESYEP